MNKIEIVEVELNGVTRQDVIIDRGNGEFTSMPKAVYEAQQVEQATLVTESAPTA